MTAPDDAPVPGTHPPGDRARSLLERVAAAVLLGALATLAIRALVRLDRTWDGLWYHVPYAARRAGLPLPLTIDERLALLYEGFPPLPHLLQGWIWRLTGNLHAVGTLNLLALGGLAVAGQRLLRAPWWMTGLMALTAPTVLIQTTSLFVDLLANAFLALGLACWIAALDEEGPASPRLLAAAVAGFAGAAWSKIMLAPLALLGLVATLALAGWRSPPGPGRRRLLAGLAAGAVVAMGPYVSNLARFGNPFWPIKVPVVGDHLPYVLDEAARSRASSRPPPLQDLPQPALFVHSLLEIGHPHRYEKRERWELDQHQAWIAYRMGGFWRWTVVVHLGALLLVLGARRRWGAGGAVLATLAIVSVLPQSHNLRYFMFFPLLWALLVGRQYAELAPGRPRLAGAWVVVVLGMWGWMVRENRAHYRVETKGIAEAADFNRVDRWWPLLLPGVEVHTVGEGPRALLLTGPTLGEYRVVNHVDPGEYPELADRAAPPRDAVLLKDGRLRAPEAYWNRLLTERPSALAYATRGMDMLRAGNHALAREHFDRAESWLHDGTIRLEGLEGSYAVDPEVGFVWKLRLAQVRALAGSGEVERAIAYAGMCARLDRARTARAIVLILRPFFADPARYRDGLRFLRGIQPLYPEAWWVHQNLAALHGMLGEAAEAAAAARVAARLKG